MTRARQTHRTRRVSGSLAPSFLSAALLMLALALLAPSPAHALSEIQREELPPAENGAESAEPAEEEEHPEVVEPGPPDFSVPLPGPIRAPSDQEDEPVEAEPDEDEDETEPQSPRATPDQPVPEVIYDLGRLPEPVRRMHGLIVEACRSGDLEALRPLIGTGDDRTQLSFGSVDGDPVDFLRGMSGDGEGHEILAILLEVLDAGFVHLDAGEPDELYVWPYFFAVPLDQLDGRQRVELFKLVTAGDYEDMKTYGAYIFYRVGITPEGRWAFFVAGD